MSHHRINAINNADDTWLTKDQELTKVRSVAPSAPKRHLSAAHVDSMEPPLHMLTLNVKTVSQQFSVTVPATSTVAQLKEEVGAAPLDYCLTYACRSFVSVTLQARPFVWFDLGGVEHLMIKLDLSWKTAAGCRDSLPRWHRKPWLHSHCCRRRVRFSGLLRYSSGQAADAARCFLVSCAGRRCRNRHGASAR